jgi:hypothetical protein
MRYLFIFICILFCGVISAQDKVIYKDGKKVNCKVISMDESTVRYRDTLTGKDSVTVSKQQLIMVEKNGSVFIFGSEPAGFTNVVTLPSNTSKGKNNSKIQARREKEKGFSNNIIGFQPLDALMFGRLTMTYERLFNEKQMGIVIPASMSFDPRIFLRSDSSLTGPHNPVRNSVGFITGLDVNYYFPTKGYSKFFVGPRFRYGTDMYMLGLTGYSVQLQNGFLLCSSNGRSASTFAIGFGYVRVTSINGINPKQSYPWGSITVRIGFRS